MTKSLISSLLLFFAVLTTYAQNITVHGTVTSKSDGEPLIGFGNSNVFSIIFAQALNNMPEKKNEISGLMIMGLFGGTIFPLAMGFASDFAGNQLGAVAVMAIGVIYLTYYITKIKA